MGKADQTKHFIIERTAFLFNTKGFAATSISDLTDATGLTKGSIYGNFQDKEEISQQAFKYAIGLVKDMVKRELELQVTNKSKLLALLDFYLKYVFTPPVPGGCPLLNAGVEVDDFHTSLRATVAAEMKSNIKFISGLIQDGIERQEFCGEINPDQLAYTFFCAIEGGILFSRVEKSEKPLSMVIDYCKEILDQISL